MWDFVIKLLEPVWNSLILWRCIALIIIIGLLAAYSFRSQITNILSSPEKKAHDKRIFSDSDAIMSETALNSMIENITSGLRFTLSQLRMRAEYLGFFDEEGNQYIDKALRNKHKDFLNALERLAQFTAMHFFMEDRAAPAGNSWLGLYPEHKNSPDHKKQEFFMKQAGQVYPIADAVIQNYKKYRKIIKSKLLI